MQSTSLQSFSLSFHNHLLHADRLGQHNPLLMLHGAGQASRQQFLALRYALLKQGRASVAADLIGHGETGGLIQHSSLSLRTQQTQAVIQATDLAGPLSLLGSSMGAYNAIRLSTLYPTVQLILCVPGIYIPAAYAVPFGPAFSAIIRQPDSWQHSDAWEILSGFTGRLLIVAAEQDAVIPAAIVERLYTSANRARERELVWLPTNHAIWPWLDQHPAHLAALCDKIGA
ncbi:alpha/beta fold hydrolase [Chitinivorax sp. B]|uniref:alpha/beta fold hydrolase n=1 Tax=Chitinivorax sp. B TaxID=2502235 RepID=UPI0010F69162|nr:alpha/beta fold hydrolase [Chitinivorax sp. B]